MNLVINCNQSDTVFSKTCLSNGLSTVWKPQFKNSSWSTPPCIKHQRGSDILNKVGPTTREVENLSWTHNKGHWMGVSKQWILFIVWLTELRKNSTPFQGALFFVIVQVLVIMWWENGPTLLSYHLVDKVIFAVNMTLSESPWCTYPVGKSQNFQNNYLFCHALTIQLAQENIFSCC